MKNGNSFWGEDYPAIKSLRGTVGEITGYKPELGPPRERPRGGGGRNRDRGHGGISPHQHSFHFFSFRKPARNYKLICDGATGARGLIDPRPVEQAVNRRLKLNDRTGGFGGLPPQAASPYWGVWGPPSQFRKMTLWE
ncbi:MAG: hypothetical protein CVV32_03145 [Methanomicrobiales archaeon HGW-Methanomicrobiales-3]|nr:MAG: hypothetical protein CVV32_03145 [Methanomicrobiales archaeon HGW-Methanomicrobiales-3]